MMPGETPPPAAAAGITAEVASACANCGVLQQNLNEYVATLIALKQKIIETDHLLTDYEQKCTELKSTERENNAFRQQVEQMLQKLSPLEKCKEELGSVKAELEEKKSSLKIYQDTHLEYERVKEEMSKSDAMKKKLEAKVKKLEKTTEKHNQDFKQLKAEKKVLEKELKKAQEKIEGFPNKQQKKVVKHVQTQSERECPVTNLDKEKIKLLLEELWLCIDSSTGNSNFNKNDCSLEAVQNPPKFKRARGQKPSHCSSPETTPPSLTSLQIKLDSRPARHGGPMENEAMETSEAYISNGATHKGRSPEFILRIDPAVGALDPVSQEPEEPGENLKEILKWVKPLPPLLSPIQFSPSTTPDIMFGKLSDSSDEEMDQDAQMLESILDNCDEGVSKADAVTRKNPAELQRELSSSSVNNESRDACELLGRPTALKPNKSVLSLDPLVATAGLLNETGAKSKDGKKPVEENSEFTERDTEIAVCSTENITENTADVTKMENKTLVHDSLPVNSLQGQEKTGKPRLVPEVATSSFERAPYESCDFTKEDEKEELMEPVEISMSSLTEDGRPSASKGPQYTEGPVLATENVLVVPDKDGSSNVIEVAMKEEGCKDMQAESDLGEIRPCTEGAVPMQNRIEEFCAQCDGEPGFVDRKNDLDNLRFHCETDRHIDRFQQQHNKVALMEAIEKDVQASNGSIKLYQVEENHHNEDGCHKDSECDVTEETKLMTVDALRSNCNIVQEVEGREKALCCTSEVFLTGNECTVTPSASKGGNKPKPENEFIVQKDKRSENVVEETSSVVVTEDCPQIEDHIEKNDLSRWLQEEPGDRNVPVSSPHMSVVKKCLPQPEGPVQTNQTAPEAITGNASEPEQFEDPHDKSEQKPRKLNVSNSIQSPEVTTEDKCLTSESLAEDGSEPLKITETETTILVAATEDEKGITSGIGLEKPAPSYSETGRSQCYVGNDVPSQEITSQDEKSPSLEPRKSAVKDLEVKEYSVTNKAILDENPGGSSAQSMQGASQVENVDPKGVSPLKLMISSESSRASMDHPAANMEVRFEFFGRNGRDCDAAANAESSYMPCVAPSTTADHCKLGEDLMDKKPDAEDSEESRHKSQEYCRGNNQDEVEVKRAVEQSPSTEAQVPLEVKGCCGIKNNGGSFEAPHPENSSVGHTSTANKTILGNSTSVLTTASEKIGSPLRNSTREHPLQEAASKETDEMSCGTRSSAVSELKTPDDAVAMMDGSASSSSEEEYPLRKVNPTKQHSGFLAFKEELDTTGSSQALALSNMEMSCGIRKLSCLAEDASPKFEQAVVHSDCFAEEATARTLEHSYAALGSGENGSSLLEACASDEKPADKSDILMDRALLDNREPGSRILPASDVGVNGDILLLEAEHCGTNAPSTLSAEEKRNSPALGWSPNTAQNHLTPHSVYGSTDAVCKESSVKTDGEIFVAMTSENSILLDSRSSSSEQQEAVSQKSELFVESYTEGGAEQVLKPADFINFSAKARAEGSSGRLLPIIGSRRGKRKSRQDSLTETVLANADTSTSTKCFPKTLKKIRQEMGPPLPPLLPPLVATPPRAVHLVSPVTSSSSQSSLLSPLSELISPLRETPVPPRLPLSHAPKLKIPATLTTPSPSEMLIGERTLSSPLQFCAATPKHALPVPGRLPPSALGSATPAVPQENSVKILDSMYPKLSARAITLNILKGNIQLSRSSSLDSKNSPPPVHQISGFKEIASASTAFVKTGTTLFSEQPSSNVGESGKRMLASPVMPKSAKRLCLDSELSKSGHGKEEPLARDSDPGTQGPAGETACLSTGDTVLPMTDAELLLRLEKITESSFDLFPVIHSRIFADNTSSVPIMRDEEKEVVYEFGIAKKCFAEPALRAILNNLRHQKTSLDPCHIQSLCRVYVGICRQLGDLEKARLFCYSLLKEDFPQSSKLILFMGNMWSEIFASESVVNKAIQLVTRKCSRGQVLKCLKTVLNWEETEPLDIGIMISNLLLAIQSCPQMEFQASEQHGEDLKENIWEYVFAIDLLCSHQKWGWTHDHIISKELWPIMDKWVKNRKDSANASSPSDVIIALVLRLIGRLSQIGLKEGFSSAVKNITSVIGAFLRHAKEKDVPWGVQLAAVYALCELGPSSPSEVFETIRAWEAEANSNSLPPAVTSGIAEVISLLKQ